MLDQARPRKMLGWSRKGWIAVSCLGLLGNSSSQMTRYLAVFWSAGCPFVQRLAYLAI